MKKVFWIFVAGVLSNAEGMEVKDAPLNLVSKEARAVFHKICYSEYKLVDGSNESSKPHSVKFSEQPRVEIDLSKPEDRHRLKLIREDDLSRPIDFTVKLTASGQVWKVTAGCHRNQDAKRTLKNPGYKYPYVFDGEDKALNYVFGYKEDWDPKIYPVPCGGPKYEELLRGFVGNEVHNRCKQVADFLILKPQSIDRIKTMPRDEKKNLEKLICLLMTSEYMRGSQALGIARMGHLFFKWHPEQFNVANYKKIMIYPSENGSLKIMKFSKDEMRRRFGGLWKISPYPEKVKHLHPDVLEALKADFLSRQLNKIRMIYVYFLDGYDASPSSMVPIPGKFRDVVDFMIRTLSPTSSESE